jgi:hypothetical protein
MAKLGLEVRNIPDASVRLDEFRQIADVSYKTKRKLFGIPDAPILLDLKLFIEVIQLNCRRLKITEVDEASPGASW